MSQSLSVSQSVDLLFMIRLNTRLFSIVTPFWRGIFRGYVRGSCGGGGVEGGGEGTHHGPQVGVVEDVAVVVHSKAVPVHSELARNGERY